MNDTFLQQLEQRTEQVKITLANLEAERVRIEGMIAQLQPLVPHYDALLAAERAIADAHIELGATARGATQGSETGEAGGQSQPSHPEWPGYTPGDATAAEQPQTPPPGEQPQPDASWQQESEQQHEQQGW
jgi:hypothetical protein